MTDEGPTPVDGGLVAAADLLAAGHVGSGLRLLGQFRTASAEPHRPGGVRSPADDQIVEVERSLIAEGHGLAARIVRLAWEHPAIEQACVDEDHAVTQVEFVVLVWKRSTMVRNLRPVRAQLTADQQVTLQAIVDLERFGPTIIQGSATAWLALIAIGLVFFTWVAAASVTLAGRLVCLALALFVAWVGIVGARARRRTIAAGSLRRVPTVPVRRPSSPFPERMLRGRLVVERPRWQAPAAAVAALGFAGGAIVLGSPRSTGALLAAMALLLPAAGLAAATYRTRLDIDDEGLADHGVLRTRRLSWRDIYLARNLDVETQRNDTSLIVIDDRGRSRTIVRGGPIARRQLVAAAINHRAAADYPGPRSADAGLRFIVAGLGLFLGSIALVTALVFLTGQPTPAVDPATLPAGRVYWTVTSSNGIARHSITCPSLVELIGGARDDLCAGSTREYAIGLVISLMITAALMSGAVALIRSGRRPNRHVERERAAAIAS